MAISLAALVATLFFVSRKPSATRALWWGAALVVVGLGGSLLITLDKLDPARLTYLSNFCLLIAGLGGNFIVGAAVMESVRASGTISGKITGELFDSQDATKEIGKLEGTFKGTAVETTPPP